VTPNPHQIVGARFLAERRTAMLADAPRVGKTGAAILALDDVMARRTLVVTTASGRAVWEAAFRDWSRFDLETRAVYAKPTQKHLDASRVIVSWDGATRYGADLGVFDTLLLDESHYAKSWETKRTLAVYGAEGLARRATERVWCLTGTPMPNAPNDLHPALATLTPERLASDPDVADYADFLKRYCVVRPKRISRWTVLQIVVGSRNLEELQGRMDGWFLRRTQADVGILPPVFEVLPIHITDAQRRVVEASVENASEILDAAEVGVTKTLDMGLAELRRVTGAIKAHGVADLVADEFDCGLDRVVLMCWHHETMAALADRLSAYGVVRLDGSTTPDERRKAVEAFQSGGARVFIGQMIAAGEAIDLSAAADLIFVESSFVPKDMAQAALRITNVAQTRQPRVRVAALAGSIDEALQRILTRKVATIREVFA
jgi:SWI/SNF-related matrix-associated actin-dependent regulator of chromatin subfamily A-like protein 1